MNVFALVSLSCAIGFGWIALQPVAATTDNLRAMANVTLDETQGHLGKVDFEKMTFVLVTDTEKLTFTVNEKTAYTLNGEKSEMQEALIEGAFARVVHKEGIASEVHVITEG